MTITITGGMTFTSGVSATVGPPVTATYLVVAGGGGGAWGSSGGGGGAGGLVTGSITLGSGSTYTVIVGAGGVGTNPTSNGSNSSFPGVTTAVGGGTGGANGGSGGGQSSGGGFPVGYTTGLGTSGQGNNGGSGNGGANYPGGGGGGAGAVGGTASSGVGGTGGIGVQSSISGTATYYAGGGGGGGQSGGTAGPGGSGGGGAGSMLLDGTAGTANTGGGGGGCGYDGNARNGGAGGSGVVIISYSGAPQFSGGVITSSGGNTIHSFYTSGTLQSGAALITNSLRFRSSGPAYLTRTPSVAGNRQKFTWSGWVKTTGKGELFTAGVFTSNTYSTLFFNNSSSVLQLNIVVAGVGNIIVATPGVYRDPASWYHFVLAVDTTQATNSNGVKMYVNGVQQTLTFSAYTQNQNTEYNNTTTHNFGIINNYSSEYFDGYMSEVNFIDGQQLTPSSFGATNSTTGVWQPISYTGTYGTNGFHLAYTNTTSTTALGYDTSGNNNNWTPNNISLTAGATYDSVTDVPTLTNASVSNYCVYNILNNNGTITNGSLRFSNTAGSYASCSGTMGMSNGKYYWEVTITAYSPSGTLVGITASTEVWTGVASYIGSTTGSYGYYNGGTKYNNAASASYGSSWTTGDVIGVTYDTSSGTLTFYKNNVSQGTAYTGLTGTFMPGVSAYNNGTPLLDINFGQQPFVYTPPLGYVQLNAYNM